MLVLFWKGQEIFFVHFFKLILPLDNTPSFSVLYFVRFTENSSTSVGEHTFLIHTLPLTSPVTSFKVARVFNINLVFMDWLLYYLMILITLCKTQYKTLDDALLFLRNQVLCPINWKLWRDPATIEFNIFCWNLHTFPSGFLKFCLDLELLIKTLEN